MSMNLIGIAGVPPRPMGGCGCALGQTAPTDAQRSAFNWTAIGLLGGAIVMAVILFEPETGRRRR